LRHFVLLFLAALAAYGLWQFGGRHSLHRVARHGIRLAAILAVLLAALVVAYNSNALKLL
jgi:Kef-type K+ transport system membrane component KefB